MALTTLRDLEQREHLRPLADVMQARLIQPYGYGQDINHLYMLKQCFDRQDHVLRAHLGRFCEALDTARAEAL